eukprot:218290-Prymnesium_polylepis.1
MAHTAAPCFCVFRVFDSHLARQLIRLLTPTLTLPRTSPRIVGPYAGTFVVRWTDVSRAASWEGSV